MTMQIRALDVPLSARPSTTAQDRRAPVRNLAQALKAGDLGAASDAYAKLASMAPKRAERNPDGPFARLGAALAAGDLDAARSAFASVFTSHLPGRGEDGPRIPDSQRAGGAAPSGTRPDGRLDVSA